MQHGCLGCLSGMFQVSGFELQLQLNYSEETHIIGYCLLSP